MKTVKFFLGAMALAAVSMIAAPAINAQEDGNRDENGKVVFGDKNLKNQTVYEVSLVYVQDIDKVGADSGLGINCPNCGAPIKNLGMKFCEYCGTGVVEVNERAWKFNSVNEQTTGRRAY